MGGACGNSTGCLVETVAVIRDMAYIESYAKRILDAAGLMPLMAVMENGHSMAVRGEAAEALRNLACLEESLEPLAEFGVLESAVTLLKQARDALPAHSDNSSTAAILQASGLLRNVVSNPAEMDLAGQAVEAGVLEELVMVLEMQGATQPWGQ